MARLPKSMKSTAEEDKFFEDQKAAQAAEAESEKEEKQVEEAAAEPEQEAEVAASEPAAEGEEPAPDTPDAEAPGGHQVPLPELLAERKRRQELQAEVNALKEKIPQLEGTFARVMERVNQQQQPQPQQPPAPEIPDYSVDPVAHLKAKIDQLEQASGYYGQTLQQQTAQQQLAQAIATAEHQFRQTTDDYDAAVEYAKQRRLAELAVLPQSANDPVNALRQEILWTSANAVNQGMSPAQVFYNYAKALGWQKPASGGNGKESPHQAAPSAAEKLATVAKAQATTRSLPRGGSAPPPAITLESLANMDDSEFDAKFDTFWRKT